MLRLLRSESERQSLARQVREARVAAGLTQAELGLRAGIARGTIASLEITGQGSRATRERVLAALGIGPVEHQPDDWRPVALAAAGQLQRVTDAMWQLVTRRGGSAADAAAAARAAQRAYLLDRPRVTIQLVGWWTLPTGVVDQERSYRNGAVVAVADVSAINLIDSGKAVLVERWPDGASGQPTILVWG